MNVLRIKIPVLFLADLEKCVKGQSKIFLNCFYCLIHILEAKNHKILLQNCNNASIWIEAVHSICSLWSMETKRNPSSGCSKLHPSVPGFPLLTKRGYKERLKHTTLFSVCRQVNTAFHILCGATPYPQMVIDTG